MNIKEKAIFWASIILMTLIWLTFGEWFQKGNGLTIAIVMGSGIGGRAHRFRNVGDFIEYQNPIEALDDLEKGKVDAVISDLLSARYQIKQIGEERFKLAGKRLAYTKGRVVFNARDELLHHKFNETLLSLIEDGIYERVSLKYFGLKPQRSIRRLLGNNPSKTRDESWTKIREKGVIIFGMVFNNPPFCFYNQDNQLTGFEVELAQLICDRLGLECQLVDVEWYGAIEGLAKKAYNALWAGSNDIKSYRKQLRFSAPYYYSGAQLVVKSDSSITGPESLNRSTSALDILFKRRTF